MRFLAYAALWLFVFTVPWENALVIPGLGVISKLAGMLSVGFTLAAIVVSGRMRRWRFFHVAGLVFVIWAGGVLWVNSNEPTLPLKFWTYPQLFLVVWMVWELTPSRQRQLGLMTAYVLGSAVTSLLTIMELRAHGNALRRFSTGTADPNAVAMTLALALPMAWYLGLTYRQPLLRWICRAYLPVGLLGLTLTGSRGGLVAALVGLLIVPLTMTTLSPARLATAIALLALSGAVAVAYVPETVLQRLATTRSSMTDLTLGGRFEIWKAGLQAFAYRPLAGYGTGGFKRAASPWLPEPRVAHNSFLSVLVEQGLIGFLLYSTMIVAAFMTLMSLSSTERRFALVLLATVLVAMLPLSWEDGKPVWLILSLLVAFSRFERVPVRGPVPHWPPRGSELPRGAPGGVRPRTPLTAPIRRTGRDASA